jgi:hypothetical protein
MSRRPHAPLALVLLALVLLAVAAVLVAAPARAQAPEPYRDPPFTCTVIDHGTDAPEPPAPDDDPMCVRYDKTNITVSTLGVIDFLAAEPARVALVAGRCSYWQQDHWVVRASPDTPPLVSWEGSYWYDTRTASAAGILRDLRVADQPADATAFIAALRPLVGDEVADALEPFADDGGGGGATFALPDGFGGDPCQADAAAPSPDPDATPTGPTAPRRSTASDVGSSTLPATGSPAGGPTGLLLLALAFGVHRGARALR